MGGHRGEVGLEQRPPPACVGVVGLVHRRGPGRDGTVDGFPASATEFPQRRREVGEGLSTHLPGARTRQEGLTGVTRLEQRLHLGEGVALARAAMRMKVWKWRYLPRKVGRPPSRVVVRGRSRTSNPPRCPRTLS